MAAHWTSADENLDTTIPDAGLHATIVLIVRIFHEASSMRVYDKLIDSAGICVDSEILNCAGYGSGYCTSYADLSSYCPSMCGTCSTAVVVTTIAPTVPVPVSVSSMTSFGELRKLFWLWLI